MKNVKRPKIKQPLPGPKARRIIVRDEAVMSPSYTRSYPLVADHAEGVWMTDTDGNVFLDMTAGIAVTSTGHCHPKVVAAIKKQADKFLHMSGTDFYYESQAALAEKLARLVPGRAPKRVFFTNSGTESVEAAFKLARYHTKREKMIAFFGAFHGRTFGALSLTGSKVRQKERFGPLVPGVTHVPYPNPYSAAGEVQSEAERDPVAFIENTLFKKTVPPEEVAAVIVEPIQGEGGYIVPPPDFHARLRELTKKFNILLIMDEIQAGMGRTGKMFAIEHWDVEPDIVTIGKGIASGLPLGAVVAGKDLMDWEPGAHASTFGGNPVACAAALETIDLLEGELIENAARVGLYLKEKLNGLYKKHTVIGDVRGIGLMTAAEIVGDRRTREQAPALRDKIVDVAFQKGMLLLGCGESAIRFSPALTITEGEIDVAVEILEKCLIEVGSVK